MKRTLARRDPEHLVKGVILAGLLYFDAEPIAILYLANAPVRVLNSDFLVLVETYVIYVPFLCKNQLLIDAVVSDFAVTAILVENFKYRNWQLTVLLGGRCHSDD